MNKTIVFPTIECQQPKILPTKPPEKTRVITHTKKWDKFFADYLELDCETILKIIEEPENEMCVYILQQIQKKICGYKSQDMEKGLFSEEEFVKKENIIELLKNCSMLCFYCKNPVQLLYKNVREPKQWTLDRINNEYGHNVGNLEIACLSCNLRRRTMYHERYAFTKQLVITKI